MLFVYSGMFVGIVLLEKSISCLILVL